MTEIVVNEWKRYGHHRGYATDASGTKLGFIDLATGHVTLEASAPSEAVTAALTAWAGAQVSARMEPEPDALHGSPQRDELPQESAVVASSAAPAPAWTDLADNLPGQAVRAQREKAWAASKDRSKFLAFGARVFDVHTDERAWRKGAEGEEYVGPKLNELRKHGWHVLHSIPIGANDSDVDHVAIGPGGVFTINSKNHQGKKIWVADYAMKVNGTSVPYLRNAKYEAERTAKLLGKHLDFEVPTRGCIVVLTGSLIPEVTYKSRPKAASVLTKWDLPKWFRRQPTVLTPEQVEAIYEIARRSTTWR